MTPDLFPGSKPRRARPRVLMHVIDAGWDDNSDGPICRMRCSRCATESDWLLFKNVTESKRGIPCEACNPETS